jgi:hypothetical protein
LEYYRSKRFGQSLRKIPNKLKKLAQRFRETDKKFKETIDEIKQNPKEVTEKFNETDEIFKRTIDEIRRNQKETNAQLDELGNRFGEVEEHLVTPGIADKFNELGYNFNVAGRNIKIYEDKGDITEIDIFLKNDDFILCVEVKVAPNENDVLKHIKQLMIVQSYFKNRRHKEKKVIGAIAGTVFSDKLRKFIAECGMYTITPSGDTFKIDVPKGFQPTFFNANNKKSYIKT